MTEQSYQASAPGSLMLLGEHAVLNGYPALVCAINKRIYVTLRPRVDEKFTLRSDRSGYYESSISTLTSDPRFEPISSILIHYQSYLTTGFDLEITSDFPSIGLGSSGALTVSLLTVFQQWLFGQLLPDDKFLVLAAHVINQAQGTGSGADAAASLLGGIVYYHYQPLLFKRLKETLPVSVIYSGLKKSTSEVVQAVKTLEAKHASLFELLYQSIGECTHLGCTAIEANDWNTLGEIFNIQQSLMDALGVNNAALQTLVNHLKQDTGILGAKISGAGLGDCVIGLGNFKGEKQSSVHCEWIPLEITEEGVLYG